MTDTKLIKWSQLLIQVRPEPRRREVGPIPRLSELLARIDHAYRRRNDLVDLNAPVSWATRPVRVRFAILRILTVHHYLHRPPGEAASQWEVIDRYLERMGDMSPVEVQA